MLDLVGQDGILRRVGNPPPVGPIGNRRAGYQRAPQSKMTNYPNIIPVGLVGFGNAGRTFHAPVIRAVPGLDLSCIVQRTGDSAREKYPDVRVVRTIDELLADNSTQPNTAIVDMVSFIGPSVTAHRHGPRAGQ